MAAICASLLSAASAPDGAAQSGRQRYASLWPNGV